MFKLVIDSNTGKAKRVEIPGADLHQDTPEQHAAKRAARSQEKSLAQRVEALETALAALSRSQK